MTKGANLLPDSWSEKKDNTLDRTDYRCVEEKPQVEAGLRARRRLTCAKETARGKLSTFLKIAKTAAEAEFQSSHGQFPKSRLLVLELGKSKHPFLDVAVTLASTVTLEPPGQWPCSPVGHCCAGAVQSHTGPGAWLTSGALLCRSRTVTHGPRSVARKRLFSVASLVCPAPWPVPQQKGLSLSMPSRSTNPAFLPLSALP